MVSDGRRRGARPGTAAGAPESPEEAEMANRAKRELVEVYLAEPSKERPRFTFEPGQLEFLPPDAPLPDLGDLILLPRSITGDTEEQTFAWGETLAPFRVVEREHVYFRESEETLDPIDPKPARYVRSLIYVRRLTAEEYAATPGDAAG
jgi:hypothetical protein